MNEKQPDKWYFKTSTMIIAFLCIGPFVLSLFWFNPRFSTKAKILISVIVIILSYYSGILLVKALDSIGKEYQAILQ